jgi:hypothetical protein
MISAATLTAAVGGILVVAITVVASATEIFFHLFGG